jgi:quercetin dioxygenase-like cupin family protein
MHRGLSVAAAVLGCLLFAPALRAADNNNYVPTRTILQQTDVPGGNYTVILAVTEIAPSMVAARHTHPGVEVSYVLQGEGDFVIEGKGKMHVKAGQSFRLESGVKHSVINSGNGAMKILAVYTIPKGAQLATPAPE